MPTPISTSSPTPSAPLGTSRLANKDTLSQVRDHLSTAPQRMQLIDKTTEQQSAGAAGTRAQTRQSFAVLRFYQENPELAKYFLDLFPEEHRYYTGVRLYAGQARTVMEGVQQGMEAAELLLLGQITEDNDRMEDHFTARWNDPQTPAGERLRLSSYQDVAHLRRLAQESQEQKKTRRQARRLLRSNARSEAARLRQAPREAAQLRGLDTGR